MQSRFNTEKKLKAARRFQEAEIFCYKNFTSYLWLRNGHRSFLNSIHHTEHDVYSRFYLNLIFVWLQQVSWYQIWAPWPQIIYGLLRVLTFSDNLSRKTSAPDVTNSIGKFTLRDFRFFIVPTVLVWSSTGGKAFQILPAGTSGLYGRSDFYLYMLTVAKFLDWYYYYYDMYIIIGPVSSFSEILVVHLDVDRIPVLNEWRFGEEMTKFSNAL